MKKERTFFWSFLVIAVIISCVLIAGCTDSTVSQQETGAPTTVPTVPPTTVPATPSPLPTINFTPAPVTTTVVPLTSEDVTQHFLDVAFGAGNSHLERLPYAPTLDKPKNSIAFYNGDQGDMNILQQFIAQFNDLSSTNQFLTNFKSGTEGDVVIKFISPSGMDAIPQETVVKEYKSTNASYSKISANTIYINSDLSGDLRDHVLLRSFLYFIGFRGETLRYPDSIFYYGDNTNTQLTLADQKAIQIMYSSGLYPGMTVDDVRKIVFVKSS